MLVYAIPDTLVSDGAVAHAMVQVCMQATAMREVFIHTHQNHYNRNARGAIKEIGSAVTAQLAASALQLHTLKCQITMLHSFPSMPNLKHLILEVRCSIFQDGIDVLSTLQNLETLQIIALHAFVGNCCSCNFNRWFNDNHCNCPFLDMTSLSQLRSLSLVGLTPEGILVCPGCCVHLRFPGSLDHPVWGILSGLHSLRSIDWRVTDNYSILEAPEAIPRTIREPWQLRSVSLSVHIWRSGALPEPLARVQVLRIDGDVIGFHVPATVSWQELTLRAHADVGAGFEDLQAFAKTPLNFRFSHLSQPREGKWLPFYTTMSYFNSAMAESRPDWVPLSPQLDTGTPAYEHISYGNFAPKCTCGACIHCLQSGRKLHDV